MNEELLDLIETYKNLNIQNSDTDLCNKIIDFFHEKGYLSKSQRRVLEKQIFMAEEDSINKILNGIYEEQDEEAQGYDIYGEMKKPKGYIKIDFSVLPKHCGECPLTVKSSWHSDNCMFGCSIWGSHIERPSDCPIKVIKNEDTD